MNEIRNHMSLNLSRLLQLRTSTARPAFSEMDKFISQSLKFSLLEASLMMSLTHQFIAIIEMEVMWERDDG